MPEFMGKTITRAQQSARIAYRKALSKAVRASVKGSGWRSVQGCLFQEKSGWFVCVHPSVHIFEEITKAVVFAKPMSIDPIFWDMTGLPENQRAPLSFRLNGAWVCRPPHVAEVEISEQGDASAIADHLLAIADEQLEHVVKSWTPYEFLSLCLDKGQVRASYLPSVVTTLVAMGRDDEALTTCEAAIMNDNMGGFLAPEGTFSEMARSWLKARIAARIVN